MFFRRMMRVAVAALAVVASVTSYAEAKAKPVSPPPPVVGPKTTKTTVPKTKDWPLPKWARPDLTLDAIVDWAADIGDVEKANATDRAPEFVMYGDDNVASLRSKYRMEWEFFTKKRHRHALALGVRGGGGWEALAYRLRAGGEILATPPPVTVVFVGDKTWKSRHVAWALEYLSSSSGSKILLLPLLPAPQFRSENAELAGIAKDVGASWTTCGANLQSSRLFFDGHRRLNSLGWVNVLACVIDEVDRASGGRRAKAPSPRPGLAPAAATRAPAPAPVKP